MSLSSYSSPVNLGHKASEGFFDGKTFYDVQEKIDGSQFSFGLKETAVGEVKLFCKSHHSAIDLDNPGMFALAVGTVKSLATRGLLVVGWTYRSEFLGKPQHNTLKYDRVPDGNIIIYDIDRGDQDYIDDYEALKAECENLGLECVNLIDYGYAPPTKAQLETWLSLKSSLGGPIEGVVIKNYKTLGHDGKYVFVKYVSPEFKEIHNKEWKKEHPNRSDIASELIANFGSKARWRKTIQHLDEAGELEGAPQDIGKLMREFVTDFETECADAIKEALWQYYRKDIIRGVSGGLPQFYKDLLAGFDTDETE